MRVKGPPWADALSLLGDVKELSPLLAAQPGEESQKVFDTGALGVPERQPDWEVEADQNGTVRVGRVEQAAKQRAGVSHRLRRLRHVVAVGEGGAGQPAFDRRGAPVGVRHERRRGSNRCRACHVWWPFSWIWTAQPARPIRGTKRTGPRLRSCT